MLPINVFFYSTYEGIHLKIFHVWPYAPMVNSYAVLLKHYRLCLYTVNMTRKLFHYNVTVFLLVFTLLIVICFRARCLCVIHDLRCRLTSYIPIASQWENSSWQRDNIATAHWLHSSCTVIAVCSCDAIGVQLYFAILEFQWSGNVVRKWCLKIFTKVTEYTDIARRDIEIQIQRSCCVVQKHWL